MNTVLQDVAVALIVVGALAWLVRRRLARRRAGGMCPDCPVADTTSRIALDPARRPEAPAPGGPAPRVQVLYEIERRGSRPARESRPVR